MSDSHAESKRRSRPSPRRDRRRRRRRRPRERGRPVRRRLALHAGEDGLHHPPHLRHRLRAALRRAGAPAASRSDGGRKRRAARHRLHGLGRRAPRPDHRHLGRGAHATPCARSPTATAAPTISCAPATSFRWSRGEGGVLMRSGHTEACVDLCRLAGLPPVGVLSELMNDDGTVMRGPQVAGLRRQAQAHARLDRRADRLPAGARQAGRARRRIPVASEIGTLKGYAYRHAVRPRASHGLRLRRHRRRQGRAGAAAPRRRYRRRVRRRQADPRRARALQDGRARRHRLPARRHRRRAGGAIPHEGDTGSEAARTRQWREIGLGAQILKDLGISSIRLLASAKRTYVGLGGFGIEIVATEPVEG